jgi:hypothetical protein
VALEENVPVAVLSQNNQYNQLAGWWTGFEPHTREHIDTIHSILQAARSRS